MVKWNVFYLYTFNNKTIYIGLRHLPLGSELSSVRQRKYINTTQGTRVLFTFLFHKTHIHVLLIVFIYNEITEKIALVSWKEEIKIYHSQKVCTFLLLQTEFNKQQMIPVLREGSNHIT